MSSTDMYSNEHHFFLIPPLTLLPCGDGKTANTGKVVGPLEKGSVQGGHSKKPTSELHVTDCGLGCYNVEEGQLYYHMDQQEIVSKI